MQRLEETDNLAISAKCSETRGGGKDVDLFISNKAPYTVL